MAMRSEADIRAMLKKFDDADEAGDVLDCDGEAIRQALIWVAHPETGDSELEQYLEVEDDPGVDTFTSEGGHYRH